MSSTGWISLLPDEIDDLLYFTRVNEAQELHQTTIQLAQKYQCTTRDILEACADPDNGNTVLHYCAANGFADLLSSLLSQLHAFVGKAEKSSIVNHQNREGNTPLHWAAYNGHLEVVKSLIVSGADMWVKNAAGHLAMFEAERADKNDVVQYMLEAGGKEVEKAGTEGQPSAEDVAEVHNEGAEVDQTNGVTPVDKDAGDKMEE